MSSDFHCTEVSLLHDRTTAEASALAEQLHTATITAQTRVQRIGAESSKLCLPVILLTGCCAIFPLMARQDFCVKILCGGSDLIPLGSPLLHRSLVWEAGETKHSDKSRQNVPKRL